MSAEPSGQIAADVLVALFEVIRDRDFPEEVMEEEDVYGTMSHRLGLSGIVPRQLQIHRENVRQGRRLTVEELTEFVRLVLKRPDAQHVFFDMGTRLASGPGWAARILPRAGRLRVAKRRVRRRLRKLFGRRLGGFISGPFALEVSASPLVQADPSGAACAFVSGFCQQVLRDLVSAGSTVVQRSCETDGDPTCRWTLDEES